ncbi:MAG: response regulator [Candidatus Micrarchaeota archaeon]
MFRILLIDDGKDDREMTKKVLKEALEGVAHEIVEFDNGRAGLVEFKRARDAGKTFGLVVTDFMMKGEMDGRDVVLNIRAWDKEVPIAVVTGNVREFKEKTSAEFNFAVFDKKDVHFPKSEGQNKFKKYIRNAATSFGAIGRTDTPSGGDVRKHHKELKELQIGTQYHFKPRRQTHFA